MNCIYSFSLESFSIDYVYIGQTQNVVNRLKSHLSSMRNSAITSSHLYTQINKKGMSSMVFSIHYMEKNYQTLWLEHNSSISPEFLFILKAFNEYHLCIRELALIHYYKPGLNVEKGVKFTFLNWEKGMQASLPSFVSTPSFTKYLEHLVESDNTHLFIFDFSIFYQLCQSTNIHYNGTESWLVWFIGYSEQRGIFLLYRGYSSFSFYSSSQTFLHLIKENLHLKSVIVDNKKGQYTLNITSRQD